MSNILREITNDYSKKVFDDQIYFSPNIPDKKLNNVIISYAQGVNAEDILVLIDNTTFGNAKDGIIITEDTIYVHNMAGRARKLPLSDIENMMVKYAMVKGNLKINGANFFEINLPKKEAMEIIADMLQKMVNAIKTGEYVKEELTNNTSYLPETATGSNQTTKNASNVEKDEDAIKNTDYIKEIPSETDLEIRTKLKQYNEHSALLCLECGYKGLMGVQRKRMPWYLTWWVLIPILLTGIGIIPAVALFIWRAFSVKNILRCPNCDSVLLER